MNKLYLVSVFMKQFPFRRGNVAQLFIASSSESAKAMAVAKVKSEIKRRVKIAQVEATEIDSDELLDKLYP